MMTGPGWPRAYLAMRYGRHGEAVRGSTQRYTETQKTRSSGVGFAMGVGAGRSRGSQTWLARLPAASIKAAEGLFLRAWFAAGRHDARAEREALEQLVAVAPGHSQGLDRLVALATDAGEADLARAFRRRQESILRDKERYRRLLVEEKSTTARDELHERAGWPSVWADGSRREAG